MNEPAPEFLVDSRTGHRFAQVALPPAPDGTRRSLVLIDLYCDSTEEGHPVILQPYLTDGDGIRVRSRRPDGRPGSVVPGPSLCFDPASGALSFPPVTRGHAEALARIATDERLLNGWPGDPDSWAPMHAVRALGLLGAHEAATPLLGLLGQDNDWISFQRPGAPWARTSCRSY